MGISNLFGALHSFVVIRLSDSSTRLIEKHHDGTVDLRLMNQRNILDLALNKAKYKTSGYKKIRSASIVGLTLRTTITDGMKRNITLKDLLVVSVNMKDRTKYMKVIVIDLQLMYGIF